MTLRFIIQKEVLLKLLMHVRCPFKNNNTVQFEKNDSCLSKETPTTKIQKVIFAKKSEVIV